MKKKKVKNIEPNLFLIKEIKTKFMLNSRKWIIISFLQIQKLIFLLSAIYIYNIRTYNDSYRYKPHNEIKFY